MKRRAFLKTVSGAAGAAALGGCADASAATKQRKPCNVADTHDPSPPFSLRVRPPGWFPDGEDPGTDVCDCVFQEEVAGLKRATGKYQTFPVHFKEGNEDSKKWVLGEKLKQPGEVDARLRNFTKFVRQVAVRARQYNASLYRLRRLKYYKDYWNNKDKADWPPANSWEQHPPTPNPDDEAGFRTMVKDAEKDWRKVTGEMDQYLKTTGRGDFAFKLMATDMVAVNGYIMSMRIVVAPASRELPGSSSHVSISSPFSSSPNS